MAKKEKKKKGGAKKGIAGIVGGIFAIIIIILLVISALLSIFEQFVQSILNLISGFVQGILNFLADPVSFIANSAYKVSNWLAKELGGDFNALIHNWVKQEQLVKIGLNEFNSMKEELKNSKIKVEEVGLDDIMLKKMILSYNTGLYSNKADIVIALSDEEKQNCDKDPSLYAPFEVLKGDQLKQLEYNVFDSASSWVQQTFTVNGEEREDIKKEREMLETMSDTYYLHANGILEFVNEDGEILQYYNTEDFAYIVKQYEENRDNRETGVESQYDGYAESAWEYLSSKCYTDYEGGIKVYSYQKLDEEVVKWKFNDDSREIKRLLKAQISHHTGIINLNVADLVAEYTTPVEFMVDLLNISQSKEFVNAFLEEVADSTSVKLMLRDTYDFHEDKLTEKYTENTIVKGRLTGYAKVIQTNTKGDGNGGTWEDYNGSNRNITNNLKEGDSGIYIDNLYIPYISQATANGKVKVKLTFSSCGALCYHELTLWPTGPENDGYYFSNVNHGGSWNVPCASWDMLIDFWDRKTLTKEMSNNTADIERETITLTSVKEAVLTVEKAITWYGDIRNTHNKNEENIYLYKDRNGNVLSRESLLSTHEINWGAKEWTYEKGNLNGRFDESIVFDQDRTTFAEGWDDTWDDIGEWYFDQETDDFGYWASGGPLVRTVANWFQGGYDIYSESECLRTKLVYGIEEGWGSSDIRNNYDVYKLICKTDNFKTSNLITDTSYVWEKSATQACDNDMFLKLLKNSDGYVHYKDVYGNNDPVARNFEMAENMLYELLESSQNTEGLVDEMKLIMYKLKNNLNQIENWDDIDIIWGNEVDYIKVSEDAAA